MAEGIRVSAPKLRLVERNFPIDTGKVVVGSNPVRWDAKPLPPMNRAEEHAWLAMSCLFVGFMAGIIATVVAIAVLR